MMYFDETAPLSPLKILSLSSENQRSLVRPFLGQTAVWGCYYHGKLVSFYPEPRTENSL
jgi:hypothetical protein